MLIKLIQLWDSVALPEAQIRREDDGWGLYAYREGVGFNHERDALLTWDQVRPYLNNPNAQVFKEHTRSEKIAIAKEMADNDGISNTQVYFNDRTQTRYTGLRTGWYWQAGFPGCLPDGEPNGPFTTEDNAWLDLYDVAGGDTFERDTVES
jgi:hypothetical protein